MHPQLTILTGIQHKDRYLTISITNNSNTLFHFMDKMALVGMKSNTNEEWVIYKNGQEIKMKQKGPFFRATSHQ